MTRKISAEGSEKRLAGSRRGAETISSSFAQVLTRNRYCELVGIHRTTLRRWEREGVVQPRLVPVRNIPTYTFTQADVDLGRRIATLLHEASGRLSLTEASRQARTEPKS